MSTKGHLLLAKIWLKDPIQDLTIYQIQSFYTSRTWITKHLYNEIFISWYNFLHLTSMTDTDCLLDVQIDAKLMLMLQWKLPSLHIVLMLASSSPCNTEHATVLVTFSSIKYKVCMSIFCNIIKGITRLYMCPQTKMTLLLGHYIHSKNKIKLLLLNSRSTSILLTIINSYSLLIWIMNKGPDET